MPATEREPGVVDLYLADQAGAAMQSRPSLDLEAGVGIVGDRYATRRGHWSDPRWREQQLTLVEAEVGEDLAVEAGLLRRNVVTRGVQLQGLLGLEFRIGEAVLAGVLPCEPCQYIETLLGRPGLLRALVGRGGLRARVLEGGRIAVGDAIVISGIHNPELVFRAQGAP